VSPISNGTTGLLVVDRSSAGQDNPIPLTDKDKTRERVS
jgi:hypothetical protein